MVTDMGFTLGYGNLNTHWDMTEFTVHNSLPLLKWLPYPDLDVEMTIHRIPHLNWSATQTYVPFDSNAAQGPDRHRQAVIPTWGFRVARGDWMVGGWEEWKKIGEYDDLRRWGLGSWFNTDYYILGMLSIHCHHFADTDEKPTTDKFLLDVQPFYTMPDPDSPKLSDSFDIFVYGEVFSGG